MDAYRQQLEISEAELRAFQVTLEKMQLEHSRLRGQFEHLREGLAKLSLGKIADRAMWALAEAEVEGIPRLQELARQDTVGARLRAVAEVHRQHKDCAKCKDDTRGCVENRAVRVLRDLLAMTAAIGQGPMTQEILMAIFYGALHQHGGVGGDDCSIRDCGD